MYYTYILQSTKDGKWYTGFSVDVRKRLAEHNSGKVFSTKGRGPFTVIYYEACLNEFDARQMEKYLKSGPGKRYLKKRLKRFLSLTGFSLIELVVTIGIFSILLAGITFLVAGPFSGGSDRRETERFAREAVEVLEIIKERDWDQLANVSDGIASKVTKDANGDWVVGVGTETRGALTRSISITTVQRNTSDVIVSSDGEVDPSTLKIAITVSASGHSDYAVESYLTNWESVRMSQQDWGGTADTAMWIEGGDDYFSSTSINGVNPVGVLKLASST